MKSFLSTGWLVLALLVSPAAALELAAPVYGSPYAETRAWSLHREALPRSGADIRADHARVLRAKLGEQGVIRVFRDPRGPIHIPLDTPGLNKAVRLASADNTNVARGHRRELMYANRLAQNPRIELLGIGQTISTSLGDTDGDITFRDTRTGVETRLEVKDYEQGRVGAEARIRGQIDKMVEDRLENGRAQAVLIRREASDALRRYAAERGVPLYENVASGDKSRLKVGALHIDEVGDDLLTSQGSLKASGLASNRPVTRISAGTYQRLIAVRTRAQAAGSLGRGLLNPGGWKQAIKPRLTSPRFWGRAGGYAAAAYGLYEGGTTLYQWNAGTMTNREAIRRGSGAAGGMAAGAAGAYAGAWAGGAVGSLLGPGGTAAGAVIGGIVGGGAGYLAGDVAANAAANQYFTLQDAAQAKELRNFVYRHYGLE